MRLKSSVKANAEQDHTRAVRWKARVGWKWWGRMSRPAQTTQIWYVCNAELSSYLSGLWLAMLHWDSWIMRQIWAIGQHPFVRVGAELHFFLPAVCRSACGSFLWCLIFFFWQRVYFRAHVFPKDLELGMEPKMVMTKVMARSDLALEAIWRPIWPPNYLT